MSSHPIRRGTLLSSRNGRECHPLGGCSKYLFPIDVANKLLLHPPRKSRSISVLISRVILVDIDTLFNKAKRKLTSTCFFLSGFGYLFGIPSRGDDLLLYNSNPHIGIHPDNFGPMLIEPTVILPKFPCSLKSVATRQKETQICPYVN